MADCMSRCPHPASKGMTDVSAYGDEEEAKEATQIMSKKKCFSNALRHTLVVLEMH